MICEECQEREAEKDVLMDGQSMSLCSKCAAISGGIIVEKPSQAQVDDSKRMWRVREILSRSAGIPYTPKPVNLPPALRTVSLEDLRRVDKDKKSSYQLRHETRMQKEIEKASEKQSQEADRIIEESKSIEIE